MKNNTRLKKETLDLLEEKDFHLMTMHMQEANKAMILASEKENIAGMDYKRLVLLSLEYINDRKLQVDDLNNIIVTSVNNYFDSEEYKKGLPYRKTIKK